MKAYTVRKEKRKEQKKEFQKGEQLEGKEQRRRKLAEAVKLLMCLQEVSGSNLVVRRFF
jgi:hypothetical protein